MSVSSIGGAASLPVAPVPNPNPIHPLAGTSTGPAGGTGAAASSGTSSGTSSDSAGELRLPGESAARAKEWSTVAPHKEKPKPPPLPPLKGLTVAEIRAMLGATLLPRTTAAQQAQQAQPGTASVETAASRYA